MTTFLDGPAQGQTLTLSRAPYFLRAVVSGGKWDALDGLEDKPADREMIFVYRLAGQPGMAMMDGTGPDGRRRGWVASMAKYRYHTSSS